MPSSKVVNPIFLGVVAFLVSLIFGSVLKQDKALLTGAITGSVIGAGTAVIDKQRTNREKRNKNSLLGQIQELEEQQAKLSESLSTATTAQEKAQGSVNALTAEQTQLQSQVSELNQQVSGFNQQKQELHQELFPVSLVLFDI
ncbi:MAG: hypothetical protein F6J92_24940 [Symploca sp. SIO1A3]|nr:hypothetical protein [Symploca sp. SIO1A3]